MPCIGVLLYSKETQIIIQGIAFGVFILLLLSGGIIYFILSYNKKQQLYRKEIQLRELQFSQQLLQSQIETQENTMAAIGRELHDNVAQLLSSTKMLIGFTQKKIDNTSEILVIAEQTLGKAIDELRNLSKSLSRDWLQKFDCIENLQAEIMRLNHANEICFKFTYTGSLLLCTDEQIILFRVLQESLQNIIKHARASEVKIEITQSVNSVAISVCDNGVGFSSENISKGLGIINMKNRVLSLNGTINWINLEPCGTGVLINIPIIEILKS